MSSLTPAVAAGLDGPPWLRAFRAAAAAAFAETPLPVADEEIWRYSRIGQLDLQRFGLAGEAEVVAAAHLSTTVEEPAGIVVLNNGRLTSCHLDDTLANKGVRLGPIGDFDDGAAQLGRVLGRSEDALVLANDAFSATPMLLSVPRGVHIERPVLVVDWTSAEGGAVFTRLVVRAEAGSEVTVVHQQRSDQQHCWLAPVVELSAANDARLRYFIVQDLGATAWQTATVVAEADQQATVEVAAAAFGADYGRLRIDCRMIGRGATAKLAALYFADGDQMLDFRTLQDHRAPDCTSDLMFKGVVDDRSHSVYSGMIRVRPEARGTNAFQTNRNIKLSDEAWAESVPNLRIENNDVRCSHASTVGPIDVDQRFYLESRGVPTRRAEQLVVSGFFDEVAARLPDDILRAQVAARIEAKLGAGEPGADQPGAAQTGPTAS